MTTPLYKTLSPIVTAMGGDWRIDSRLPHQECWLQVFSPSSGYKITVRLTSGRLSITTILPYTRHSDKITVSASRSVVSIAKDIHRRLLTDSYKKKYLEDMEIIASKKEDNQRIQQIFGAMSSQCESIRDDSYARFANTRTLKFKNGRRSSVCINTENDCGSISTDRDVPIEKIFLIIAILNS